ncbi:MAG: GC-type dockerin domain-anchored protein [Phycisphaerales bacterium]
MQKKYVFATAAVAGLATAASAQTRLSHNLEETVVTAGAGIACAGGTPQTTTDNFWSRSFTLADYGVTEDFTVSSVEFGVENLSLPTVIETTITVDLYEVPAGSAPRAPVVAPLGSDCFLTTDRALEIITLDIDGTVSAGTALMVEVVSEDLQALGGESSGNVFFIGGNSCGQTAPSYVRSAACGIFDPTDVADFGFPDAHFLIIAVGEGGGGGGCPADIDGDGSLTIFDFLAFQTLFDSGDLGADFDGDGVLTIFDFLEFQTQFDAGCP